MTPWTIAEWRKAHLEGVELQLPSELVVRVRPVNVATFLRAGRIPDQLTPVIGKLLGGIENVAVTSIEDMLAQMDLLDAFAETCIVTPRVVRGPECGEDEITLDMLSDVDKQFLFGFIGRPASELARFRPEPKDSVDDLVGEPGRAQVTE
jgi:hypothetical protein